MHPARYLLLLNLKSPSWSLSSSQHKSWRWEDIASALSMGKLPPLSVTLARAKYCEDVQCRQRFGQQVLKLVRARFRQHQWRSQPGLPERLAELACYELLAAHRCSRCDGRGCSLQGLVCEACRGHGREPMSTARRYRCAGVEKRNWERRWSQRYEQIFGLLCEAENRLLSHLSWQLND